MQRRITDKEYLDAIKADDIRTVRDYLMQPGRAVTRVGVLLAIELGRWEIGDLINRIDHIDALDEVRHASNGEDTDFMNIDDEHVDDNRDINPGDARRAARAQVDSPPPSQHDVFADDEASSPQPDREHEFPDNYSEELIHVSENDYDSEHVSRDEMAAELPEDVRELMKAVRADDREVINDYIAENRDKPGTTAVTLHAAAAIADQEHNDDLRDTLLEIATDLERIEKEKVYKKLPKEEIIYNDNEIRLKKCGFKGTIPKDYCCPITCTIFQDPVTVNTGKTYEREELKRLMGKREWCSCPVTRGKIYNDEIDNECDVNLLVEIEEFITMQEDAYRAEQAKLKISGSAAPVKVFDQYRSPKSESDKSSPSPPKKK